MKKVRTLMAAGAFALAMSFNGMAEEAITLEEAWEIAERADAKWEAETYYSELDTVNLSVLLDVTSVTPDNEKETASIPLSMTATGDFETDEETGWSKKGFNFEVWMSSEKVFNLQRDLYIYEDEDTDLVRFYLRDYYDEDGKDNWVYLEVEDKLRNNPLYFSMNKLLGDWNKYHELLQFEVDVYKDQVMLSSYTSLLEMKQFIDRYEEINTGLSEEAMQKLEEWMDSVVVHYMYSFDWKNETVVSVHEDYLETDIKVLNEFLVAMQQMYYQKNPPADGEDLLYLTAEDASVNIDIRKGTVEEEHLPLPDDIENAQRVEDVMTLLTKSVGPQAEMLEAIVG